MSDSPQSPPKDVEQSVQSPDDEGQMNDNQDPHSAGGISGYDFEVKEQDRWLPIANGESRALYPRRSSRLARPTHPPAHVCFLPELVVFYWCPVMSSHSPPASSGTSCHAKADTADEPDANIRNFAPVARIMKNALPDNAKIAKEAKECMQECVSEFISFITSEGKYSGSHLHLVGRSKLCLWNKSS